MKNLIARCSAAVIASFAVSAGTAGPATAQDTTVRVAIHNIPPFGGVTPGGVCFDILSAMAERSDFDVNFQPMAIGEIVPAVLGGNVDAACSGLGPDASLARNGYAFTSGFGVNGEILLVRSSDTAAYTALADLRDRKVGAIGAYMPMARAAGLTDLVTVTGFLEGIAALQAGEIDVFLTAATIWGYQHNVLSVGGDIRQVDTYVTVGTNFPAMMTRADNSELLGVLQAGLESLKADGTLAMLLERWGLPAPPY